MDPKDLEIARLRAALAEAEAALARQTAALPADGDGRKRAEERLPAGEHALKRIVDATPALIWSATPDGHTDSVNQHFVDYVGATYEQLEDEGWQVAIHPEDHAALDAIWDGLRATGKAGQAEARLRRHDGTYRWFLLRTHPLLDEKGKVVRWYGVNTDIEDRKRAEQAVARSQAFLAQGEAVSETGSFLWNLETDDIRWSDQLSRIYDFAIGSPVTVRRIAERMHPLDRGLAEDMASKARAGLDSEYEYRLLMPDGSVRHLHFVAKSARDPAGRLEYMGTIQDITGRKLAEQAHDKVRSELAHAARVMSLGVLTASLAHEVNQPLAGIVTNANTCLRMLSSDPPNVKGALETARRTIRDGHRASEVVARLRALFAKKEFAAETVDLNGAAREVIALSAHELQRNHIAVATEFATEALAVRGDRVQIQQVILNLLLNACDALKGVEDGPRLVVVETGRDDAGSARLSVRDSGIGIAADALGKLFDPFFTTKPDGMGIGLSVSRSIVDRHKGRLWATPNAGPGATFVFSLPLAGPDARQAPIPKYR